MDHYLACFILEEIKYFLETLAARKKLRYTSIAILVETDLVYGIEYLIGTRGKYLALL